MEKTVLKKKVAGDAFKTYLVATVIKTVWKLAEGYNIDL